MTTGTKAWQCITPGCGRARYQGEWCDACTRRFSGLVRPGKTPRAIRETVHPTGETRRAEGHDQVEMTDGRQRWWVRAMEVAA